MKIIPLSLGNKNRGFYYFTYVDDEDYEWLMQWKWYADVTPRTVYAVRNCRISGHIRVRMHREIMRTPEGMECDHINHDGLNNLKTNLRNVSKKNNRRHRQKPILRSTTSSSYKGVAWHKRDKVWHSQIGCSGTKHHLGYFTNELDAAKAYNEAAIKYFGEYAKLNELPN